MKGLIAALLVTAALAGGVSYGIKPIPISIQLGESEPEDAETVVEVESGVVATDVIAIPLVDEDGVEAYLIARFNLETNANEAAPLSGILQPLAQDILIRALYEVAPELEDQKSYAVYQELGGWLVERLNAQLGAQVFSELFVTQLDVLPKEDVRTPREAS